MTWRCLEMMRRGLAACLASAAMVGWAQDTSSPTFDLVVDAPAPLDAFLLRHAELNRFRELPGLTSAELERLVAQSARNMRDLLGTQGYFNPTVQTRLEDSEHARPRIRIEVDPGVAARISRVEITLRGAINDDAEARQQRAAVNQDWGLPVGEAFSQSAWDAAKGRALRTMTAQRFPRAQLVNSLADVIPDTNEVQLFVELDSGPAVRLGPIQIDGVQRYEAEWARRMVELAGVRPGEVFDEALLQDAQRRLTESGYFPSAFVWLAPEGDPQAHPVIARVREVPLQKAVLGLGFNTDRGPRLTLEHTHHRLPGIDWRGVTRFQWESDTTTLGINLSSPIDEKGWRWITGGEAQRQLDGPRRTVSQQWLLGQSQDTPTLDRSFFVQWDRSVTRDTAAGTLPEQATAISANYAWTRRRLDDLTAPQRGYGLGVELGTGVTLSQERRPYLRSRVRWLGYWPIGEATDRPSRLALRVDLGGVWAQSGAPVPVNQRFLAGGDNSVRGYSAREIGVPLPTGGVEAGRWMTVASVEWQRPIWRDGQRTAWESTVFIDTGAVANRPGDLSPVTGIGAGVRYNSPVGPLQADLGYGIDRKQLRLHLSVGFTF